MVQFNANRFLEFYVRRKNAASAGSVKDGATTTATAAATTNTPTTYLSTEILDVNPNPFSTTFWIHTWYRIEPHNIRSLVLKYDVFVCKGSGEPERILRYYQHSLFHRARPRGDRGDHFHSTSGGHVIPAHRLVSQVSRTVLYYWLWNEFIRSSH